MTPHESFTTFANRVMHGNNLLIGTPSRLDTTALRAKLEINMSAYLAEKITRLRAADRERIAAILIFEDWLAEITLLDEENTADLKHIADFAAEHIAKRQRRENPQPPQYHSYQPSHSQPRTYCIHAIPSLDWYECHQTHHPPHQPLPTTTQNFQPYHYERSSRQLPWQ
jgi:hypothetical protein